MWLVEDDKAPLGVFVVFFIMAMSKNLIKILPETVYFIQIL